MSKLARKAYARWVQHRSDLQTLSQAPLLREHLNEHFIRSTVEVWQFTRSTVSEEDMKVNATKSEVKHTAIKRIVDDEVKLNGVMKASGQGGQVVPSEGARRYRSEGVGLPVEGGLR